MAAGVLRIQARGPPASTRASTWQPLHVHVPPWASAIKRMAKVRVGGHLRVVDISSRDVEQVAGEARQGVG